MRLNNSGDHRELSIGNLMRYLERSFQDHIFSIRSHIGSVGIFLWIDFCSISLCSREWFLFGLISLLF